MMKKATLILAAALGVAAMAQAHAADGTASSDHLMETLPSGVKVEHIVKGTGNTPKATGVVTVHYRGTLLSNGAEFDNSYRRGQPISFGLNQVIPCWTEGMQRLAVGSKAVLFCPAKTAYGARGAGSSIPPNADLRFEVALLAIQ